MRHQVSTNRTGIHRIVRVRLFDTIGEMVEAYARRFPDDPFLASDRWDIEGLFIPPADWDDRDPNPYQGEVWLPLDVVTMTAVVHEATHAAGHLVFVDGLRDHSRASAWINGRHELLPYLVADLSSDIARLVSRALADRDRTLDIGEARYYTAPEYPAYLPRHADG